MRAPRRFVTGLIRRINEPRVVSVLYFFMYLGLLVGGIAALVRPPTSIEGQIGTIAMVALAVLLTFGSFVGALAVLPGTWWLERTAVLSIGLAAFLYLLIVVTLHFTSAGNRLLQAGFVLFVLGAQGVRWARIARRPYDPERPVAL